MVAIESSTIRSFRITICGSHEKQEYRSQFGVAIQVDRNYYTQTTTDTTRASVDLTNECRKGTKYRKGMNEMYCTIAEGGGDGRVGIVLDNCDFMQQTSMRM